MSQTKRNNMRSIKVAAALATLSAVGALPAQADEVDGVPANTVRLGLYEVLYHASSTDLSGPFTPEGLSTNVKDLSTLYIGYTRKLSTHWVAELALALPPLSQTVGVGPATVGSVPYNGQVIAKVRWLAPTALLEYAFFDDSSAWRPYVGVGVNFTSFYDRRSTAAGDEASGGPTRVSLTNSVGPAGTIGISWHPMKHFEVNGSFSAAMVDSTSTTDTAGVIRKSKINFNPTPFILSLGYSF